MDRLAVLDAVVLLEQTLVGHCFSLEQPALPVRLRRTFGSVLRVELCLERCDVSCGRAGQRERQRRLQRLDGEGECSTGRCLRVWSTCSCDAAAACACIAAAAARDGLWRLDDWDLDSNNRSSAWTRSLQCE